MMYNRYIPDAQGVFHATQVDSAPEIQSEAQDIAPELPQAPATEAPCASAQRPPQPPPSQPPRNGLLERLLPQWLDTGDLLLVLIVLLLVLDSSEDDGLSALLVAAAVLLF